MYFQFLIEDRSTEILIGHIMEKLKHIYSDENIEFNTKSLKGIGHLSTKGNLQERKGGNLLKFIPLWLSIIVADIWNIVDIVSNKWSYSKPLKYNLVDLYKKCQVSIWVVIIIFILMLVSIISINKFLKDMRNCSTLPNIKINKS